MSSSLGKIFLPAALSRARNRFRSRKLGEATSSRNTANQLSCSVSISSFNSSRVAAGRPATHFSLSNLGRASAGRDAGAEAEVESWGSVVVVVVVGIEEVASSGVVSVVLVVVVVAGEDKVGGAAKKEVMLFCFCFLPAEAEMEVGSFRLRGVDIFFFFLVFGFLDFLRILVFSFLYLSRDDICSSSNKKWYLRCSSRLSVRKGKV